MRSYKLAFFMALGACVILAAIASFLWLYPKKTAAPKEMSGPGTAGSTMQMPAGKPPAPAPEAATEPKLAPVQLTPQRMQAIGVKTGAVQRKQVRAEIRTVGNVDVDETRLAYVQVRFSGWIQKVFADATFQFVRKGQALFTIYSPELVTTEQEYLLAKENRNLLAKSTVPGVASGAESLLSSAAERLRLWDIPEREIAGLERTGTVRHE